MSNKKAIIYLHDFNSGPKEPLASSANTIAIENDFPFYNPKYNSYNLKSAEFRLNLAISQIKSRHTQIYFIGNGLGGFWAAQLVEKHQAYPILINPVIEPYMELTKWRSDDYKLNNSITNKSNRFTTTDLESYKNKIISSNYSRGAVCIRENDPISFNIKKKFMNSDTVKLIELDDFSDEQLKFIIENEILEHDKKTNDS